MPNNTDTRPAAATAGDAMRNISELPHVQWKSEFPGFDMPSLDLPVGFEDTSWHNDACPSFTDAERRLRLYVNFEDPDQREWDEVPRFVLVRYSEDHSEEEIIAEGEKWETVEARVKDWPVERFRRLPIADVSDADLIEAEKTLKSWQLQIECGSNFVYASGQAATLAEYRSERYRALDEIKRRGILYLSEHPSWTMPDISIPEGFADSSCRNDACPSWISESAGLRIWIDYEDPEMREFEDGKRFMLVTFDPAHGDDDLLAESDDFEDIRRAIEARS